jgi:predicted O-methyltransferase YrrM
MPMIREFAGEWWGLLWRFGRLMSVGVMGRAGRHQIRRMSYDIGFRRSRGRLFRVSPQEVFPADLEVSIRETAGEPWNVKLEELLVLNALVRQVRPSALFEFGTFDGRTTLNLAINAPEDAKVYTIDLKPAGPTSAFVVGSRFQGTEQARKIVQLYGNTLSFDFSPYVNGMDFVFIDAAHEYANVLSDSRNAINLLRDGKGLIVWHDYEAWPGVTAAIEQLVREDPRFAETRHIAGTTLAFLWRR